MVSNPAVALARLEEGSLVISGKLSIVPLIPGVMSFVC